MDLDGEVVDVYLQAKRDGAAAERFFRRLIEAKIGTDLFVAYFRRLHRVQCSKINLSPFFRITNLLLTGSINDDESFKPYTLEAY